MAGLEKQIFKTRWAGKELSVEFSNLAQQANGSVIVRYGDTAIMANAVMSRTPRETVDYFPLTVDYEEKFYAAGRILGSRFIRREARPSEEAVLISRLIDRTIRPLFDARMRNEIQLVALALSVDDENSPDILAILASSLALLTSDIPWQGPITAVRACIVDGDVIINPPYSQRAEAKLDLVVSGKTGKINMIEGKAQETDDKDIVSACKKALEEIEKLNKFQLEIASEINKEKYQPEIEEAPDDAREAFTRSILPRLSDIMYVPDKKHREHALGDLKKEWMETCLSDFPSASKGAASDLYEDSINEIVHQNIMTADKRPDGRKLDEVRELLADVGFLPRTHGSGLFFRGDTHIMSVVTLGAPGDELLIEGMEVRTKKNFMHHYNFPPFSVGETGRMGSPKRREIGHGALAEKALEAVIPPKEIFPYTIRIVSETMSSNGSSSMGSVCASTLALMDAGVPIKEPVAGIAMGLVMSAAQDKELAYKVLTDIQGPEDHHGDMDFKVAGTKNGVTAIQMDVKVDGITISILEDALKDGKKAYLKILQTMLDAIPEPREELSQFAPRVISTTIPIDKIRDVIGPGGKIINEIIAQTGAQIDIEQDGTIFITGINKESAQKALERVEDITHEFQAGEVFTGKVSRIFDFGAMVEIKPGQEGLVHISELAPYRVGKVTDIVKAGDEVTVKIINIDNLGRINLSIKALDKEQPKSRQ